MNDPFMWPNSSLSSRASGRAAQFTATSGALARGLREWMAPATMLLPVPVSPRSSTGTSTAATRSTSSSTSRMPGLVPIIPSPPRCTPACPRSARRSSLASTCRLRSAMARFRKITSSSGWNGLVR